jgi:hypothetical protein
MDRMTTLLKLSLPLSTDFGNANFSKQGQSPLMAVGIYVDHHCNIDVVSSRHRG